MKKEDLFGAEFGSLTVLSCVGVDRGNTVWICVCQCGAVHSVRRDRLGVKKCMRCIERRGGPVAFTFEQAVERFWRLVERGDGCWLWRGNIRTTERSESQTRGRYSFQRRGWYAHRFAWLAATGQDPGRLCVCHTCDNGLCCRPDHLFLGTQQENVADMDRKGRRVSVRGERVGSAKLTVGRVLEIRARVAAGAAHADLAREFDVTPTTIRGIAIGRIWKHVA